MRIGIVTQPLHNNYGGILQNYALQQILRRLGHTPVTIDYIALRPLWKFVLSTCKTIVLYFVPKRRRPFASYRNKQTPQMQTFTDKHIVRTYPVKKYTAKLLEAYHIDSLVVGSDQVWRPCYNRYLEDMFLAFARKCKIKKIAYSASFGVNAMEFSKSQLKRCVPLLQQFDKVSVREGSGVDLCQNYFQIHAEHTLDPTLLLSNEDYEQVCATVPKHNGKFIACYILDMVEDQRSHISRMAQNLHLETIYFATDKNVSLSVEEWLAMFRDAAYVVTDSFHGTVFSIIFRKPFISIVNKVRGADRFTSLLKTFGLETRSISSMEELTEELYSNSIDWHMVDTALSNAKKKSMDYLEKVLIY